MRTVILQRVIPHYRAALFERVHDRLGWIVATGSESAGRDLNVVSGDRPWIRRFDFIYSRRNRYRTRVPIGQVIEATRADAVVAEFSLSMNSTWRLALDAARRRRGRAQLAFWSHGPNVERGFRSPSDVGVQALRLGLLSIADANVCYSHEGAEYLRRWLPNRRPVFIAQNTVDVEAYPGRGSDRSPTDPATPNLLFVGRFTPDKRVPLLVEVFRELRETIPGATLTLVGDGADMPAVRAAAAGLEGSIRLLGAIYDPLELAAQLQSASLFVYTGSIGLAANHALAYGVPVVIFDDPGAGARHHPEHAYVIDGVTGYRVPGRSATAFAQRLVAVLTQTQTPRALLSGSIASYVEEHLHLERMVDAFAELDGYFRRMRADSRL